MRFRSLRWRLTLNYAALALLTVLALGAVLLTSLRGYYARLETAYLESNVQTITPMLIKTLYGQFPPKTLSAQLEALSFFYDMRIQVTDAQQQLLADSGVPEPRDIISYSSAGEKGSPLVTQEFKQLDVGPAKGDAPTYLIIRKSVSGASLPDAAFFDAPLPGEKGAMRFISIMPRVTTSGFWQDATSSDGRRSTKAMHRSISTSEGQLLGYVTLSAGPAYGRQILEATARGWALAGLAAVLLAAGVGWFISRRISEPVLALTQVTSRMAAGNLAVRADIAREDELGILARSYNRMADQVENTINTLRRFVADAAHELQTPLTALHTNLELALGEGTSPLLEHTQDQVMRLETLISSLLDLSRLEAQSPHNLAWREESAELDLVALVRQASELYASRAEQAGLDFSLTTPAERLAIRGNAAQLDRALGNLLDNACKFTPEGGAVSVWLRKEGERAELRVQDNGIGIPEEDLPLLFGRFHRGRNVADLPGNGLGLALVKIIVEAHGGQIAVTNTYPGACLTVWLPLAAKPRLDISCSQFGKRMRNRNPS